PGSTTPAGTTTSAGPAYTCWNGVAAAGADDCSYPTSDAGMRYMFPNLSIGCTHANMKSYSDDVTDYMCRYDNGNSWIVIIQWRTESSAINAYDAIGGRGDWICGSYRCGVRFFGYNQDKYSAARIYSWPNHWSVVIRGRTKAMRSKGYDIVGGVRSPAEIKGHVNA
ncbi:MAG TPA: hypothetical protein VN088_14455, partial [Nocardioides sp.]|nr:hypothetical protein [Nocardioides sp.]